MNLSTIVALPLLWPFVPQETLELLDDDKVAAAELQPGQIPEGTSEEAAALWTTMVDAMLGESEARQPVHSFDLRFDMRARRGGSHDVNGARILYKSPNWISSALSKTNRLVRGPEGDFLIGKEEVIELIGRDAKEDRALLNDTVNIAHNFAVLTEPSRLRIQKLAVAKMPTTLPANLQKVGEPLRWLEAESPDFRLYRTKTQGRRRRSDPEPVYRAVFGIDPKRSTPTLVVIAELQGQRNDLGSALLVRFDRFGRVDGYQVPHYVATRSLDPRSLPLAFGRQDDLELWLAKDGRLNVDLGPELFSPPKKDGKR